MKRLMYVIPLSVIAVLVFAAIAAAQSGLQGQQDGQEPSQNPATGQTTDVQNSTTLPAKKEPAETNEPAETTTPAKSTVPATDTTVAVDINDLGFAPPQLNIAPGTRVMFVNNGEEEHTATADNELFDTGKLARGESTWVYFRGSGTVTYHDQLHPEMKGIIDVGEGVGGEGVGGGDTAPQKGMAEEAPNEPSIEAAKPASEAAKILAPEVDKPLRG